MKIIILPNWFIVEARWPQDFQKYEIKASSEREALIKVVEGCKEAIEVTVIGKKKVVNK